MALRSNVIRTRTFLKSVNVCSIGLPLLLLLYKVSEKSGTNGNCIYYLHYMLYMFTLTLCAFSQPLCNVCADFAQHIAIDSSTTVCNSLPKVPKISDFIITAYTIPDNH
jgi:hypothetical protein